MVVEALNQVESLELSGLAVLMLQLEVELWRGVLQKVPQIVLEEAGVDRSGLVLVGCR